MELGAQQLSHLHDEVIEGAWVGGGEAGGIFILEFDLGAQDVSHLRKSYAERSGRFLLLHFRGSEFC